MKKIDMAVKYTDNIPQNWHQKNIMINKALIDGLKNKESEKMILEKIQKALN